MIITRWFHNRRLAQLILHDSNNLKRLSHRRILFPIQIICIVCAIESSPKNLTQKIWRFRCYGCAFVLLCLSALSYTEPPLPLRSPDKVLKIMEKLGHFMTSNLLHRPAFVWVCFVQGWTHKTRATLFNCVQICSHCKMLSGELLITWRQKLIWMPKLVEVANIKRIYLLIIITLNSITIITIIVIITITNITTITTLTAQCSGTTRL